MAKMLQDNKVIFDYEWDMFMEDLKDHNEIFLNLHGDRISIFPLKGKMILMYKDKRYEYYSIRGILEQDIYHGQTISDLWEEIEFEEVY